MATSLPTGTEGEIDRRNMGAGSEGAAPGRVRRWVPMVGGTVVALLGLRRRSALGMVMAAAGGAIAYASATGRAPLPDWVRSRLPAEGDRGLVVERGFTILRPREDLYRFWRDFENLPRFMPHLQSVTVTGDRRSHWTTSGPAGTTVEWDADLVEERPNELLRWESLPGSQVENRGEVRFSPAPGDRGTEVRVRLEYEPPAGIAGATVAQLLGEGADRQVRESVRRFKSLMEAGEIPTNDGQPMGTCR